MLRAEGWQLETMDERYGKSDSQRIPDTQWIEEATLNGDVIMCKDLRIAHNELEAQVVYMSAARVFGLSNRQITGPEMARSFLSHEPAIIAAARADGPYVMAVHLTHKLRRISLNYPPDIR
ncbi:hypothetical protein GCM10009555_090750 [Acrocarpospora macrocephala]